MKALILPFQKAQALAPLRSLCPDFLLPLAGKPMVEHLVEQLVTHGIRDLSLLCDDRPEVVARHFGNGERWGCVIAVSAVRDRGGLQRMVKAALHGVTGAVVCLPGNLAVSRELSAFPAEAAGENVMYRVTSDRNFVATDAETLLSLIEGNCFETFEELAELTGQNQHHPHPDLPPEGEGLKSSRHAEAQQPDLSPPPFQVEGRGEDGADSLITGFSEFLQVQRSILEGKLTEIRIPARSTADGIWIGDHVQISPDVRLIAPLFIGSRCRISGGGQIGPNAVISPYCLINNSDLICDSLVMSGTATGSHTELNGVAARGNVLVNLRNGATVTSPDAFILGDIGGEKKQMSGSSVLAAILLLLLLPLGLPLLAASLVVPTLLQRINCLGNRRMKTLAGESPRMPFTLRQFSCGPLLLRRWPGLAAVIAGDLALVGAAPAAADKTESAEEDSLFGLDAARGLFHIWEVEGDPPESVEERHARENFHYMTRTIGADLQVVLKAATAFLPAR